MNSNPMFIYSDQMATEALDLMRAPKKPTAVLPVLSRKGKVVGMVHLMDLVSAGLCKEAITRHRRLRAPWCSTLMARSSIPTR